jgi:alkylhydroperoxidase family enzyme
MTYIETVTESGAEGTLARQYAASRHRDGRVAGIVSAMSQNPEALDDLMRLYTTVSRGPSGLTRAEREMIAVVVSRAHRCRY